MALYYVITFNRYFDGVEGKMLKESLFMKKLSRNVLLVIIGIAAITIINTQNTMYGKLLTVNEKLDIVDLQKAIQLLRKEEYKITDKWIYKINKLGRRVKFKEYRLEV